VRVATSFAGSSLSLVPGGGGRRALGTRLCGLQNVELPCSPEFISLAEIIMREDGLMMPKLSK